MPRRKFPVAAALWLALIVAVAAAPPAAAVGQPAASPQLPPALPAQNGVSPGPLPGRSLGQSTAAPAQPPALPAQNGVSPGARSGASLAQSTASPAQSAAPATQANAPSEPPGASPPQAAAAPVDCGAPAATDDWQAATPEAVGLDPAILCGIGPRFQAWIEADVHSVLVVRHGKLVYERYFSGTDERLGHFLGTVKFDANTQHDLRSITKSVVSLLLGIAVGKGQIAGADQPIMKLLPEYADLRTEHTDKLTIRDLLTMSLGFAWNEDLPYSNPENSEIQMDRAADPVRFILSRPAAAPPGTVFNYSGGAATIIGRLLRKATGEPLDTLARTELFEPLGIHDFEWDPIASGEPAAASGLRLRPRDTAKLGQLVLDHGSWHGHQVVPADWIAAATTPQINANLLWFYGYQFWLGRSLVHRQEVDWAVGLGYGGQRLFIVPALDMVVLVHCGLYSSPIQGAVPLTVLNRYVLPAVHS